MITNFPIDLMFEQPDGWLRASLPKMMATTSSIIALSGVTDIFFDEARSQLQRQNWVELTGVEPTESRFSIIIPVHNEERSLPSFLGALFTSEIPSTADVQIVFVVNASSDKSFELIKRRLSHIGCPDEMKLFPSIYDLRRSDMANQICRGKINFLIVETTTAGKANALNIGNEIARWHGYDIALNIDANNWVEPDSVALMYGRAKQAALDVLGSSAVIVNAKEYCPIRNMQTRVKVKVKTQRAEVTGCMFAWSTQWIFENNGFPQHAIEDYGTGLLALMQKKKIVESDANIWVYSAENSVDENMEMIRFVYGAMQLARRFKTDPIAMQILLEDFPHLRPIGQRLEYHISRKRKSAKFAGFIRGIMRWLLDEWLIFKAQRKLRRDPTGQTWDPIRSTK